MSDDHVFMAQVGEWMREQRAKLNIRQSDVAAALGCSVSTVSGYERGEIMISIYSHAVLKTYFRREWTNRTKPPLAKGDS